MSNNVDNDNSVIDIRNIESMCMVIISLWDSMSGPRVEKIWRMLPNELVIKDNVLKNNEKNSSTNSYNSTIFSQEYIQKEEEKKKESMYFKNFSLLNVTDIAYHISRYTLGGETLEYLNLSKRRYHSPVVVDPLNIFTSSKRSRDLFIIELNEFNKNKAPHLKPGSMKRSKSHSAIPEDTNKHKTDVHNVNLDVQYRVYCNDHSDYFTLSSIYTGIYEGQTTKFTLSFVFYKKYTNLFRLYFDIILDRLNQLVFVHTYLIQKKSPSTTMTIFNQHILKTVNQIESLFKVKGINNLSLDSTLFCKKSNIKDNDMDILLQKDGLSLDVVSQAKLKDNEEFLCKILTSFFQTHKRIIVVSENIKLMNLYIATLALFISKEERLMSSYSTPDFNYIPDLYIQGLNVTCDSILKNTMIFQSTLPTTIVDLDKRVIYQTHYWDDYNAFRKEFIKYKIQKLINDHTQHNLWSSKFDFLFQFNGQSIIISKIIKDTTQLSYPLKMMYIYQSLKLLECQCYTLIKYIEALQEENVNNNNKIENNTIEKHNYSISKTEDSQPILQRSKSDSSLDKDFICYSERVKQDQELGEHCFRVLLGISLSIKSNIYAKIAENDKLLQQSKWIKYFEMGR